MTNPKNARNKPGIQREKLNLTRAKVDLKRDKIKLSRNSGRIDRSAPDFDSIFDDGDEGMFAGAEFDTGDLQGDSDAIMSEALRAVIERKKATQERFRVAIDPEFYTVLCFQSREQKEEFLKKAGWIAEGEGGRYLNGLEIARKMEIDIEVHPIEPLKLRGKPNRFKPDDILRKGGKTHA